jgi:hypothetical protein
MNSNLTIKFFVSDLFYININSNSDSKACLLSNFVNILDYFNDLGKNNNLLNNLFKNVRNLDNLLNCGCDRYNLFFKAINNLHFGFNIVLSVLFDD